MEPSKTPAHTLHRSLRLLGGGSPDELAIRQAAWVARCVGRGEAAPFSATDLTALAAGLRTVTVERGAVVFRGGAVPSGVWIVQRGRIELSVGSGRKRAVVHLIGPGDVDGDIQHLLAMPLPYTGHALEESTVLFLDGESFERLLASRHAIARRWLSSVAMRLAASQERIIGILGRTLTQQVARLIADEAVDGAVPLPRRTLAAMLGVQRPSLNKVLKDFERKELIAVHYGAIGLRDPEQLAILAE
ncbi:Crp/Fnr family transcriptional regulator [Haloechinothrix halophila]|uniref:Crp/Fnr family transcriptional regulator n=1 Tax=Haloechinothrix halophila TaxID=1069073 RepID=UPI00068848D3|nr:Crp/Fnr family transcriptional regulator [Haloechinothrix halophila]